MQETRYVAFVRNIMVGRRGLTREVLLEIFNTAGARDTRSYIATGNFAFSAAPVDVEQVSVRVEAGIEAVLGHREEVFIRTVVELQQLDQAQPFAASTETREHSRAVTFLPQASRWTGDLPYRTPRGDIEVIAALGPNVFAIIPRLNGMFTSPHGLVERLLKARATARNWNTVERILRAEAPGPSAL